MITDTAAGDSALLVERVREAVEGGASVIQLRDKTASNEALVRLAAHLLALTRPRDVPLIINDRVEVARRSGADGLHLGQEDGSLEEARRILGPEVLIGRSTHSREQALKAEEEGFDYIGVGPVYDTPTKPDYPPVGLELVRFAAQHLKVPFVAIGGIDETNISEVLRAGAKAVAVVRAVSGSPDPRLAVKRLLEKFS